MARSTPERRRKARVKAGFSVYYAIFLIFVYGPMFAMFTLSFQGPRGGVTFPMRGLSFYWWEKLTGPSAVGDIKSSLVRSLILAVVVMMITALFSTMLAMAFRKQFPRIGSPVLRGDVGLDGAGRAAQPRIGVDAARRSAFRPAWWYSGLGVHVVWTLPFGFLVMMAVFNRFDARLEEAARDMGADEWTVFKEVTLPLITPGIVAAGLFGFTLSYDEFARTTLLVRGAEYAAARHQRGDDAACAADPVRARYGVDDLLVADDRLVYCNLYDPVSALPLARGRLPHDLEQPIYQAKDHGQDHQRDHGAEPRAEFGAERIVGPAANKRKGSAAIARRRRRKTGWRRRPSPATTPAPCHRCCAVGRCRADRPANDTRKTRRSPAISTTQNIALS